METFRLKNIGDRNQTVLLNSRSFYFYTREREKFFLSFLYEIYSYTKKCHKVFFFTLYEEIYKQKSIEIF